MSLGLVVFILLLLGVSAGAASLEGKLKAPAEGVSQVITMKDGSSLVGRITEVGETEVKFQTDMGEMTLQIDKISDIKEIKAEAIKGGKYWFPNPNRTRMLFGPTARTLRKGEGFFNDIYIFFPGVAYGITDNITIGGGMSLFPGLDIEDQLYYLTPKIGTKVTPEVDIAASAMIIRIPNPDDEVDDLLGDEADPKTLGVFFGSLTYGTDDKSATFGLGFGYFDDNIAKRPAVTIGGEYRVARRMSLVSENWIFPEVDQPIVSYGVRFFGESLAVDLALFNLLDEDAIFPGIPFIDFIWNF
jgi:hypothetical protein